MSHCIRSDVIHDAYHSIQVITQQQAPTRGRGRGAMPRGGTFGEKKEKLVVEGGGVGRHFSIRPGVSLPYVEALFSKADLAHKFS